MGGWIIFYGFHCVSSSINLVFEEYLVFSKFLTKDKLKVLFGFIKILEISF